MPFNNNNFGFGDMGGGGGGGQGAQVPPMGGGMPAPQPQGPREPTMPMYSNEPSVLEAGQARFEMSPMGIGSRLRRAQEAYQAAQLAGADPYRLMNLQNEIQSLTRLGQQRMTQMMPQVMNPGLGGVGNNAAATPPRVGFGQEALWQQIIAAMGLGGGMGQARPSGGGSMMG